MLHNDTRGATQPLVIPMIITVFLLVIMTGISIWAYSLYTDQRNNVDAKIAEAVADSNEALRQELNAEFAEREKSPLSTFQGAASLGSITAKYPKTWSAYVEERESGSIGIDAYFHPRFVPDLRSGTAYALRLVLENDTFDDEVAAFQKSVESGELTSTPITISDVRGVRLDGKIEKDIDGSIILMPLRDKTLKVFTESTDFVSDFNETIIPNISFIP